MLTLQQMRDLVRKGLGGLDEQDLSDPDLDLMLNMSFWEIESRFPFKEKEARLEFSTVEGSHLYDLPSIAAGAGAEMDAVLGVAVIETDSGKSNKLQRMTESWFDTQFNDDIDVRAIPEFWLRRDVDLQLWPVPDEIYTIRLFFLKNLASLLLGTVEATGLPRTWDELVVEGGITRGQYYGQDYNLAQQAESFRVGKLRTASSIESKEEEDSRWAGLVVQWDEPGSM